MVSIGSTLGCTPSQHDIQQTFPEQPLRRRPWEHVRNRGARGVKRGAHRQPGRGVGGGRPPIPLFLGRPRQEEPGHVEIERGRSGTLRAPPPPGLGFALFQSPASTSLGFSSFRAPPPLGTTNSSTPHQPISQASSSDDEERVDDTDDLQRLRFGHRVGKKTTRLTPFDWP
ncbi:hypothetical protein M9H77_21244 [Catharanthus roseus]|uniref:Uncharacterized protein n=1 Tax=Catharanthus roseus TaxID=4058 RepID=A0ACC0AR18_CATRO|nr:hypothetical protein M9H77_21244 [Catharanthus roseus]